MGQKTVLYRDIDGFSVISCFSDAAVDPALTEKIVSEKRLQLPELIALNEAKAKLAAQVSVANMAKSQGEYDTAVSAVNDIESTIPPLESAYSAARDALWLANQKYCQPGQGEGFISDEDYASLSAKLDTLPKGSILCLDGSVMPDNRTRSYWVKGKTWARTIVSALGEAIPKGAIFESDLTPAQLAEIQAQESALALAEMSDADKLTAAQAEQKAAKGLVVTVQTEVTAGISTEDDLAASVSAYKATLAAINSRYGTSLK